MEDFNTNRNIATEAKKFNDNKAVSNSTKSISLSDETKEAVIQFFEDDDVSRPMPGQKDYVSINKMESVKPSKKDYY